MTNYFAYIRVSTLKQGESGVSLQEQRDIMQRYAAHKGLTIVRWFEEMETASKVGRPLFNQMMALIKKGSAGGVIIHKVDRSARNRLDWAELMELAQVGGIDVHFASESLDLNTAAGMFSADIQAAMAVHYSRNLSEETKKGYYGRLKQGLCPSPAPLGYLNNGRAKPKTIDPLQGPIVKQAFLLYATGRYSLIRLVEELYKGGLRSRTTEKQAGGRKVGRTSVAAILSNPFYIGVLYVKKTNRTFVGVHQPLISRDLFEKVQNVLAGKSQPRTQKHCFQFSRLITCSLCGRSLVAETHKGHVYYRCHSKHSKTILREQEIAEHISDCFQQLRLSSEETSLIDLMLGEVKQNWEQHVAENAKAEELRLALIQAKLERLTDAYIDGLVDKTECEQKKTALTLERREVERRLADIQSGDTAGLARWSAIVERIKVASLLYETGNYEEKRQIVNCVMSNLLASNKSLDITLRFPFSEIVKRNEGQSGCPPYADARTFWTELLSGFMVLVQKTEAGDTMFCE